MAKPKKLELNLSIDLEAITKAVEDSKTLEDNELIFAQLSAFGFDKQQVAAFNDAFEEVERQIKQVINDKAKALYGPNWTAIKGTGYKISRSQTGSTFHITDVDNIADEFVKVKIDPNSRTIEDYIKAKNTLPDGVAYNPNRGEQIRINVNAKEPQ